MSGFEKFEFKGVFTRILPSTAVLGELVAPEERKYGLWLCLHCLSTGFSS